MSAQALPQHPILRLAEREGGLPHRVRDAVAWEAYTIRKAQSALGLVKVHVLQHIEPPPANSLHLHASMHEPSGMVI